MKKMKFDASKLNTMLLQHVEKIVLGLVVLIAMYMVYHGYSLPAFEGGKGPADLKRISETGATHIRNPNHWPEIRKGREPSSDLDSQLAKSVEPNIDSSYRLAMPWKKPDFPRLSPRTDPKLLAPIHLKVVPMQGPLAYTDQNASGYGSEGVTTTEAPTDPLDLLPGEEPVKKAVVKKPKPRRPVRVPGGNSSDYYGVLNEEPPETVNSSDGYSSMPGYGSGSGIANNIAGKIHPEAVRGYRPTGNAMVKPAQAMVILAVVPYEKQIEEYEKALSESLEYNILRDSPRYLLFNVERADVTDDPTADPSTLTWVGINTQTPLRPLGEISTWAGSPTEIMDPNYLDPVPPPGSSATGSYQPYTQTQTSGGSGVVRNHQFQKLTHPAPPFLLRDTWEMLTHPDVPLMKLPTAGSGYGPRSLTPRGRAGAEDAAPAEDIPGIPQPGMGTEGGYGGYGAEYGGSGYGGSGYGSGEGTGTGVDPLVQPKYKLIRFTDMSVEAGRQYRYRLKVFLEDPNYPSTAVPAPPPSSLSNEVQDRVKKLTVADAKASADKTAAAKRTVTWKTFWRESDWSEPSEPVTLPPTEKFLALSADPPVTSPIMPNRPQVPNTQPSGKLLAVKWDPTRVADLAAKADVYRGSTLTFRAEEALAVHPVRLEMRSLPKVMFNTGAIVADIQGGDPIPQVKKSGDPLKAPAEILIFTADGQLSVEDGGTDIEEVRMHTVMEEKAAPDPYMSSSGSSEEGYEQMMNGPVRGGAGKGRTNRRVSP